jgi:hypothetical protein
MTDAHALISAIESHLAAHPSAADSAEGVARWWLGDSGVAATAGEVEPVLALLVRRHRLRRVLYADGRALYCGAAAGESPMWRM